MDQKLRFSRTAIVRRVWRAVNKPFGMTTGGRRKIFWSILLGVAFVLMVCAFVLAPFIAPGKIFRYEPVKPQALTQSATSQRSETENLRHFPNTILFINNHRYGETNGLVCDLGPSGEATCGHPGAVSRVKWNFLRTTEKGDEYRFTRIFPSDSANPGAAVKEVTYSGGETVLWKDGVQQIVLRPKSSAPTVRL